jgi:hypothetical protein
MATKKITELSSGSLSNLPLSGVTTVVYSGTTFQHTLNHLRQKLVDSGSHVFTGSQTINGNLIISGSLTAQQYILSSSVTNIVTETISGSTQFGNSFDDTHKFIGPLNITGSVTFDGGGQIFANYDGVSGSIDIKAGSSNGWAELQSYDSNQYIWVDNNGAYIGTNFTTSSHGWTFDRSGSLTIPGDIINGSSSLRFVPNSSGDGYGYSTIEIKPQSDTIYDQYLIIDPTYPNHIHIRAGGVQDNSSASLFLGGEISNVTIPSGENPQINIVSNNNLWSFNPDATITFPDSTIQSTAYTGFPNNLATTGSNTFIGNQVVTGSGIFTNGLEITGSLDIRTVSENLSISGGFSGSTFDYTSGSIFYLTGLTGNGTWNVTNVPTTNNKAFTMTFIVTQGVTPYSASAYQFNSSNVTVKWADSAIPTGSANKTDVIGLTAFRVGSTWNVLGSLSSFGS